jgi:hypothetical protein
MAICAGEWPVGRGRKCFLLLCKDKELDRWRFGSLVRWFVIGQALHLYTNTPRLRSGAGI